jgi:DNA mismatch repair protein MutS
MLNADYLKNWKHFKEKYPDAIMLMRIGDFYEIFCEDAIIASRLLGLTLTHKTICGETVPLCGIPCQSFDRNAVELLRAGHKIAQLEQIESQTEEQKKIKRDVVRITRGGIVTN